MFAFISFLTNCILSKICVPRELTKFSYGMVFNQDKQKKIVHSLTVCDRRLFLPQNPAQTPSVYMPCRRHRPLNWKCTQITGLNQSHTCWCKIVLDLRHVNVAGLGEFTTESSVEFIKFKILGNQGGDYTLRIFNTDCVSARLTELKLSARLHSNVQPWLR